MGGKCQHIIPTKISLKLYVTRQGIWNLFIIFLKEADNSDLGYKMQRVDFIDLFPPFIDNYILLTQILFYFLL